MNQVFMNAVVMAGMMNNRRGGLFISVIWSIEAGSVRIKEEKRSK
ncbi:hypothetical protein [Chromohalobacter israelensis]|nr:MULTISPECIES: hypothetical protein [Chromohalobacter]